MKRVAVIGGGSSGIMAACFASGGGNSVVLFEKQKKLGKKVLVSGNGRCNITNRNITSENYHGANPRFVLNVFSRFGLEETIEFFRSVGLPLVEEKNGKMFPASLQSASVMRIMEFELSRRGVEVRTHRKIEKIRPAGGGFTLITAGREEDFFDSVILAAGSCANTQSGGSRDGYDLARQLGHTMREPFPAILPITIPLKIMHRLQGVKWDCAIRVLNQKRTVGTSQGELLFTAYGISGPAALDVSRAVNEAIIRGDDPRIVIDLFPGYSETSLAELIDSLWSFGSRSAALSLTGILKNPMPDVLLRMAGIEPSMPVKELGKNDRNALVNVLKGLILEPGKPRGFDEAVVAAGGVDVDEVNPATMESRLVKKFYLTGELLDIDGDSGGYNLQFAWSTGALAGMAQH